MDRCRLDLIAALFTEITCRLEQSHDLSVDGQSSRLTDGAHNEIAENLITDLGDISALAAAVAILARRSDNPEKPPERC